MNSLASDPVVLICGGIILVGLFALFWAFGKFRRLGEDHIDDRPAEELFPAPAPTEPEPEFRQPPIATRAQASPAPSGSAVSPGVSKDVSERLESMTQRLSEMQTVLMKQSAAPAQAGGAGPAGGVGQGFSPETIDKLLKIIGNVIQQVDILQKSLNIPK